MFPVTKKNEDLIWIFIISITTIGYTQEESQLQGRIVADGIALDAIHVLNTNKNKGVISDQYGNFEIVAEYGDILTFSSVGYQKKTHVVTNKNLIDQNIEIILIPAVNELDEVTITPYSLSGNLHQDLNKITTYEDKLPIYTAEEIKNMNLPDFNDAQSPVRNLAYESTQTPLPKNLDFNRMINFVFNAMKNKKKEKSRPNLISTFYSEAFIIRSLGVPATKYFERLALGIAVKIPQPDDRRSVILYFFVFPPMIYENRH